MEELKDSRDSSLRNIKITRNGMTVSRRNEGARGNEILCSTTNRMTSAMRGITLNSRQSRAVGMYIGTGIDVINAAITRLQQIDSVNRPINEKKKKVQTNNCAYYKRKAISKFHPLSGAVMLAMLQANDEETVRKGLDALIAAMEALPGKVSVSPIPLPFFYFVSVIRDLTLDRTNKVIRDVGRFKLKARNVKAFVDEKAFQKVLSLASHNFLYEDQSIITAVCGQGITRKNCIVQTEKPFATRQDCWATYTTLRDVTFIHFDSIESNSSDHQSGMAVSVWDGRPRAFNTKAVMTASLQAPSVAGATQALYYAITSDDVNKLAMDIFEGDKLNEGLPELTNMGYFNEEKTQAPEARKMIVDKMQSTVVRDEKAELVEFLNRIMKK